MALIKSCLASSGGGGALVQRARNAAAAVPSVTYTMVHSGTISLMAVWGALNGSNISSYDITLNGTSIKSSLNEEYEGGSGSNVCIHTGAIPVTSGDIIAITTGGNAGAYNFAAIYTDIE